jgi:uncharacterized protein YggE
MEVDFSLWKKYLSYLLAVLLLIFTYSWITSPLVMSVTGVGEVSVPAENAVLTFTLASNKVSPSEAVTDVKNNITNVKNSLKNLGIGDSDVYESQVAVTPSESGFQATVNMGLKVNSISNLDQLTTSLYGMKAIVVSQPQLSVKDSQKVQDEVYQIALKDAKSKANKMALKNWKLIKKIVLIQESETPTTTSITKQANEADQTELNIDSSTGLIKFSKVLSVTYKLW